RGKLRIDRRLSAQRGDHRGRCGPAARGTLRLTSIRTHAVPDVVHGWTAIHRRMLRGLSGSAWPGGTRHASDFAVASVAFTVSEQNHRKRARAEVVSHVVSCTP